MPVIEQLMFSINFHSISFPTIKVNGFQQLFGSLKFLNIYIYEELFSKTL